MNFKIILPFKTGEVTKNGDVYPEDVMRKAIDDFNKKTSEADVFGGVTDRERLNRSLSFSTFFSELPAEEPTHKILDAMIAHDKQIIFNCETLDTDDGRHLENLLKNRSSDIEYLPIIETPHGQPKDIDGVSTITEIIDIRGISISMRKSGEEDEHQ